MQSHAQLGRTRDNANTSACSWEVEGGVSFVFHCVGGMCICGVWMYACVCESVVLQEECNSCSGGGRDSSGRAKGGLSLRRLCGQCYRDINQRSALILLAPSFSLCLLPMLISLHHPLARVKWQSEVTTTPSSAPLAACTQTCGTPRIVVSSPVARARLVHPLSACPPKKRRGRNCRRRSSTA